MKKTLMLAVVAAATAFTFSAPNADAAKCPNGPEYTYVSRNPQTCLTILYFCEPGSEPFYDAQCGCGCVETN